MLPVKWGNMTIYQSQPSNVALEIQHTRLFSETTGIKAHYRDARQYIWHKIHTSGDLKFDLTYGFSEQILSGSVRFKLGNSTYGSWRLWFIATSTQATAVVFNQVNPLWHLVKLNWAHGHQGNHPLTLESLITTTDLPPINKISFRTPIIPVRPQSMTIIVTSPEYGQLILTCIEKYWYHWNKSCTWFH